MSQNSLRSGLLAAAIAGLILPAGTADGQAVRFVNPYGNVYYPGSYNLLSNTAIPTYPPSVNYPAFYNPLLPGVTYSTNVATFPPSINYPAFYNPVSGSTDLIPRLGFFPTIYSSGYSSPVYNPYALEYQLAGNPFTYSNQVFNTDTTALQTDLTSAIVPEALVTYTPAPVTNIGTNYPDVFKLAPSEYQKARRAESRQSEAGSVMLLTRSGSRPTAYIDISLPASAELYVEGVRTGQAGRRFRRFVSPPLASGQQYAYNVRATWTVNGHQVTQRRRVSVRAGDWVELDFNASRRTR